MWIHIRALEGPNIGRVHIVIDKSGGIVLFITRSLSLSTPISQFWFIFLGIYLRVVKPIGLVGKLHAVYFAYIKCGHTEW